jgi:hypothetical protein
MNHRGEERKEKEKKNYFHGSKSNILEKIN